MKTFKEWIAENSFGQPIPGVNPVSNPTQQANAVNKALNLATTKQPKAFQNIVTAPNLAKKQSLATDLAANTVKDITNGGEGIAKNDPVNTTNLANALLGSIGSNPLTKKL
jgi:2-oxo-4-hydroxy-4-carboxy--5-ureidoimidazoline (OHCU) decarboxylase